MESFRQRPQKPYAMVLTSQDQENILVRMDNAAASNLPTPASRLETISEGGVRLIADYFFGAAKPSVMLSHGFGQTRQSWLGTQRKLAELDIGSLAWDMRAHGESDRNADDIRYELTPFVDDVMAVSQHFDHKPVLVGASMGGLTGLMAQAKQDIFSALVLVDVTPRWEAAGMQRILDFMSAFPDGFDSYDHAAEVIANYLPHRRERKSNAQLQYLLREQQGRLHWHWDRRLLHEFIEHDDNFQDRVREAAASIRVPVLLISGGKSDLVSQNTVNDFLELVPHAQHQSLPQATHMVAGDDNDNFSNTLITFLQTQFPSHFHPAATGVSL
jgi:pimeloyl-ACP methyl ester carboxylesterase